MDRDLVYGTEGWRFESSGVYSQALALQGLVSFEGLTTFASLCTFQIISEIVLITVTDQTLSALPPTPALHPNSADDEPGRVALANVSVDSLQAHTGQRPQSGDFAAIDHRLRYCVVAVPHEWTEPRGLKTPNGDKSLSNLTFDNQN